MELPSKTRDYDVGLTDTSRWQHFNPRPDDVFVCTLPKNGTTWMQSLVCMILFESAELDFVPQAYSPWFDARFRPVEETAAAIDELTTRRVIKTHSALDGIPYFPECTYITVWRDPRDAFISMRNHMDNMILDMGQSDMEEDTNLAFRTYVDCETPRLGEGNESLAAHIEFFQTYWRFRHVPNIHFFHYANLKADLELGVRQVAQVLGKHLSDDTIKAIAAAGQFEAMKAKADKFVSGGTDFWREPAEFLKKGQHGQWQGVYSDETLEAFDVRLAELLDQDLGSWLINGGEMPA